MGSSSSQTPVTQQTQQTKDPWVPAQPYLQQAMGAAGTLFNDKQGYQPYTGATQAPLMARSSTVLDAGEPAQLTTRRHAPA